jgi:hypothetical protein
MPLLVAAESLGFWVANSKETATLHVNDTELAVQYCVALDVG